jgi:MoaA/NifB/PqqE/SkfB family radical SAM enzyme
MKSFKEKLTQHQYDLCKAGIDILQVNVGKLCNLTCSHCHVEAGPTKVKENMDLRTAQAIVPVNG